MVELCTGQMYREISAHQYFNGQKMRLLGSCWGFSSSKNEDHLSEVFSSRLLENKAKKMKHMLRMFQYIGLWRPVHWRSGWKTKFYNFYTVLMMITFAVVIVSQCAVLTTSINNLEEFASNTFLLLTEILDYGKAVNVLVKRGEIIGLTRILQQDPCLPKCEAELAIQHKYDRMVRFVPT